MCTGLRFTSTDGKMYFGRNLDWGQPFGEDIAITPKGYPAKYSYLPDAAAKHAMIGTAVVLDNYPLYFDCGNDAGLACGGLNFPGYAQYEPEPVSGKTNVAAFEVPFWICANFETVDQVEEAIKDLAIVSKSPGGGYGVSLLHWMVADAERSIVLEYMPDGLHVYHDDVDTLTNQPTFPWHMENLRNYMNCESRYVPSVTWDKRQLTPYGGGANMRGIPGDYYSPSRMVKVAYLNANYPAKSTEPENVARMFHTLGNVSMVEGASQMENGDFEYTLYTSCFSAATMRYYFATYEDATQRFASLDDAAGAPSDKIITPELRTA